MTFAVPLGVRFFSINFSLDMWVTKWVEDVTFRSTVPGGFASATIKVTFPPYEQIPVDKLTRLYTRVQIIDLRSAESVWEGRIEDPATNTVDDSWDINVLGSQVVSTDIQRPVFYADNTIEHFVTINTDFWSSQTEPDSKRLISKMPMGLTTGDGNTFSVWRWNLGRYTNMNVARFTIGYEAEGPSAAQDQNYSQVTSVGSEDNIDVTQFDAAATFKSNRIGVDFTGTSRHDVTFRFIRDVGSGSYTLTGTDAATMTWYQPYFGALRLDIFGDPIVSGAEYTTDYVLVWQVIEDVIGRFMNGGWHHGFSAMTGVAADDTIWKNLPWPGHISTDNVYIDKSDTNRITNLAWVDGTTAKEILDTLMLVQADAYWGIWESRIGASEIFDQSKFRFEWATWPKSWGYLVTSEDGVQQQPTGEDLANVLWMKYKYTNSENFLTDWSFDTSVEPQQSPDLDAGYVTRMATVVKEGALDGGLDPFIAHTTAVALLSQMLQSKNAGKITVRRPIPYWDPGKNSDSGAGRMIDPWMIRPGKLVRVVDQLPQWDMGNFVHMGYAAYDDFGRSVSNGWGTADSGEAWTLPAGMTASNFAVNGTKGTHTLTTVNVERQVLLSTAAGKNQRLQVSATVSATPTGAPINWGVLLRYVNPTNYYWIDVSIEPTNTMTLRVVKRVAGVLTQVATALTGLTHVANTEYTLLADVSGSVLRAKLYLSTSEEPVPWGIEVLDYSISGGAEIGCISRLQTGNTNSSPVVSFDKFLMFGPPPTEGHNGVLFRVVGTTYNSKDNSCVMELDQPTAWDVPTQVVGNAQGGLEIRKLK